MGKLTIFFIFYVVLKTEQCLAQNFTFPPLHQNSTITPSQNTTSEFTFPPLNHTTTTTQAPNTTSEFTFPPLNHTTTTTQAPNTTSNFTWPALNTTTTQNPNTTSDFTWAPLHTTQSPLGGNDLIPIIVGAALGGLVVIVLLGYIFVQWKKKKVEKEDREKLVE